MNTDNINCMKRYSIEWFIYVAPPTQTHVEVRKKPLHRCGLYSRDARQNPLCRRPQTLFLAPPHHITLLSHPPTLPLLHQLTSPLFASHHFAKLSFPPLHSSPSPSRQPFSSSNYPNQITLLFSFYFLFHHKTSYYSSFHFFPLPLILQTPLRQPSL